MHIQTTAQRSRMMAGIRGRNTRPEVMLRSMLFARGFRYRLHVRRLPGSPDLVFSGLRAVVFVHGCFWHRHGGCRYATTPRTNAAFWNRKFLENEERDRRHGQRLHELGWRVAIVWECALKHAAPETAQEVEAWLRSDRGDLVLGLITNQSPRQAREDYREGVPQNLAASA